jgi:hypothetical protein
VAADAANATTPARDPKQDAPPPASPVLWRNSRWAVTDAGLESLTRAGPHDMLIVYRVPATELLRTRPDTPGVSSWAMQLAGKSWVDDVDALIDAIAQALRVHHPGQSSVDLAATALEARRIWARSHRAPERRQSASVADAAWLDAYPPEHRDLLAREGMPPGADRRALEFNERLIGLAGDGLAADVFRAAVEHLTDDLFAAGAGDPDEYEPDGDDVGD